MIKVFFLLWISYHWMTEVFFSFHNLSKTELSCFFTLDKTNSRIYSFECFATRWRELSCKTSDDSLVIACMKKSTFLIFFIIQKISKLNVKHQKIFDSVGFLSLPMAWIPGSLQNQMPL